MPQCAHCGAVLEKPQSAWQKKQAAGEKPPEKPAEKPAEKPRPKTWYSEWQPRTFSFVSLDSASKSHEAQEADEPDEPLTLGVPRPLQPILAVLALLAVAAVLILFALPRRAAPKALVAASAPATASAPAALSSPAMSPTPPVPLTVTLSSSSAGKRVAVGTPVTIAAFATLVHGQSATLAVSFRANHGRKTLLSLAQGSLSSAVWTPLTPGRYVFQANVLDERRHSASSERLTIQADAAPPSRLAERLPPRPVMAKAIPARLPSVAPRPSVRVAAKPVVRRVARPIERVAAAKPAVRVALKPTVRVAAKPRGRVAAARPIVRVAASPPERLVPQVQPHFSLPRSSETAPVHVSAAAFLYERNATLLAAALRARGFRAVARRGVDGKGQPAYVVQTGIYLSPERARSQMRLLQSDGYPAYSFQDSAP